MPTEEPERGYYAAAAAPEPPRLGTRPSAVGGAHTGYALLFLLVVAILLTGLIQALTRPAEESVLLRQLAPRPRPTLGVAPPPAGSAERANPGIVIVVTTTPPPQSTPTETPVAAIVAATAPPAAATAPPAPAPTSTPAPGGAATPGASPPPRAADSAQPRASPTPPPGSRLHVVESGDTLFQLALRYGSTVEAIMGANDIADRNDPVRVGARLVIPPR